MVAWGGDCRVPSGLCGVRSLASTLGAFAALCADGHVIVWGDEEAGGSCSVPLLCVQEIKATSAAFAALLSDSRVVAWGAPGSGGDSSCVQQQLYDVDEVQASCYAFVALRADGHVITWGGASYGGDSGSVQEKLASSLCSANKAAGFPLR